jgi:hypothetical protein
MTPGSCGCTANPPREAVGAILSNPGAHGTALSPDTKYSMGIPQLRMRSLEAPRMIPLASKCPGNSLPTIVPAWPC